MVRFNKAIRGLTLAVACLAPSGLAYAYTAAGDRLFPATVILPQIAPGEELYVTYGTLPLGGGPAGTPNRSTNFTVNFDQMITDDLGITIGEAYTAYGQNGGGTLWGWQNQDGSINYTALRSIDHEFLMSLGLDREVGGTGAARVGAAASGATTPQLFFGKGLGDLDIGYLRPLAITGLASVQFADAAPRPDQLNNGLVVEYSIPYLESKVQSFDLPAVVRGLTPMAEFQFISPAGKSYGTRTTILVAPGVSYAGEGWEFAVEAMVPETRATGSGFGVTAQLHLSLDFLFPDSIGKPIFASR